MITVSRRYRFCASHRLHVADWSDAENQKMFGKCNNPFGHGHNYELEVSVDGEIDPATGRAVNLQDLDAMVTHHVIARYDHQNLNAGLPEFAGRVPTTENLGASIREHLHTAWSAVFPGPLPRLRSIRIFETERNIFQEDVDD